MGAFKTLGNLKEIREGWAYLCDAHEVAQVAPGQLQMRLVIRETDHVITAGLALPESAAQCI